MLFKLEPGDTFCDDKGKRVNVKIDDEESISLPHKSYTFNSNYYFIVSNFMKKTMNSILTNLSQGLNLKLERVGGDYKLALVDNADQYYYAYYVTYSAYGLPNNLKISTFDSIPDDVKRYSQGQKYIYSYGKKSSLDYIPLVDSKVLIDPKDIMSSKDIYSFLKEHQNSSSHILKITPGRFFLRGENPNLTDVITAELCDTLNNKIGALNNIVTSFVDYSLRFYSREFYLYQLGVNDPNEKLEFFLSVEQSNGNNYLGCILMKGRTCLGYYIVPPEGFGQESGTVSFYPHYYYLHGFRFSMNHKKIEELERQVQDLKEKFQNLQGNIRNFAIPSAPGLDGRPGDKGEQGIPGKNGADASPQEVAQKLVDSNTMIDKLFKYRSKENNLTLLEEIADLLFSREEIHIEVATELVTSKKAELEEAVLNANGIKGENLATQIAGKINLNSQELVNKIDVAKLTEGVVNKLPLEEAKNIIKDTVSKIISDATKKNNPDPIAFQKYEKFAEKLAKLLVDRSSMSEIEINNLIKGRVSDWALAKYLLLHSDLSGQAKALEMVKQEINKEKLIEHLFEYAKLKGDVNAAKTIIENIIHQFFNTKKVGELGRAVLEAKDDKGKKILVDDPALQKGIAEELRRNPGKIKGDKGAPGIDGLPGVKGDQGIQGKRGEPGIQGIAGLQGPAGSKGDKGDIGSKGAPGIDGLPGVKGDQGIQGKRGEPGIQGIAGLQGPAGSKGDKGNVGPRGSQGNKGDQGLVGPRGSQGNKGDQGLVGPQGFKGLSGSRGAKGEQGHSGMDANPEEVADKLVTTRATRFKEMMLNFTDSSGKMLMEELTGSSSLHTGIAQKLIDNETIVNKVLEYRDKGGDLLLEQQIIGRLYDENIHERIANKLIDNRAQELADALLSSADNDILVEKLANSTELTQSISEELRKNPEEIQGPKGEKGEPGLRGFNGTQGLTGNKGEPGIQGIAGLKGQVGSKGDKGDTGSKGDKGGDAIPEEVAQKLINNGTIANQVLEYRDQDGDLVLEKQVVRRVMEDRTIVENLANNTELTQSIAEELRKNLGEVQGPKGEKGEPGLRGFNGTQGLTGNKGEPGMDGLKGDIGPQGIKGEPGPKGKDGVGGQLAGQFLDEITKAKNETLDAKKAAEEAKNASESFVKKAENATSTIRKFATDASNSEINAQTFYNKTKEMFCIMQTNYTGCGSNSNRTKREINNLPATNRASGPFSWINVFANAIVDTSKGAYRSIFSSFKSVIDYGNSQSTKAMTTQSADIDGVFLLLDLFIRKKITGQKYISTVDQSLSPSEALEYSLHITKEFEEVVKYAATKSGISVKNLSFNFASVQSIIVQHINKGQYSEIAKILYSTAKEACPHSKQTSKFLAVFKDNMERILTNTEQLVNTEKTAADNEKPRSFISDIIPPSRLSETNQKVIGYLR